MKTEVLKFSERTSQELIDGHNVQKLHDHYDDIVPFHKRTHVINGGERNIDQKTVLKNMLKGIRKGKLNVNYCFSKSAKTHGRLYAHKASLQLLCKELRHTLCKGVYRDYDIVNCSPTILSQYCSKKDIEAPFLKDYVENRDERIQELMDANSLSRNEIKEVILSVLNGGFTEYEDLPTKTFWMTGFFKETNTIRGSMVRDPENKSLLREIKKEKGNDTNAIMRSLASKVYTNIESKILECCFQWCDSVEINTESAIPFFDGFMLPEDEKVPDDWAEKLSNYVFEQTGYRVSFVEKPIEGGVELSQYKEKTPYIEIVNDVDESDVIQYVNNPTPKALADLCLCAFGSNYVYDGSTLYVFRNNHWDELGETYLYESAKSLKVYITPLYELEQFKDDKEKKKVTKALSLVEQSNSFRNMLYFFKPPITDKTFPSKLDTNIDLLAFDNGVFDFIKEQFRDTRPEDMVFKTNSRKYRRVNTTTVLKDGTKICRPEVYFNSLVLPEDVKPLTVHFRQILRGGNKEQMFNFWVGDGGNGKSLAHKVVEKMLGKYCKEIPKELYTKEKKSATGGEPELLALRGVRGGFICETEDGDTFLVSMFKKSSGGDTITARLLHSNTVVEFTPTFKPIVFTNHLPKFNGIIDEGIARRIRIFKFPYTFKDDPNPNDPFEKKRDYDMDVLSDDFIDEMINYLLYEVEDELVETKSMIDARMSYIRELNPLQEYWDGCVHLPLPQKGEKAPACQEYAIASNEHKVLVSDLRQNYNEWAKLNELPLLNAKRFGICLRRLTEVKQDRYNGRAGVMCVRGLQEYIHPEEKEDDVKGQWMGGNN